MLTSAVVRKFLSRGGWAIGLSVLVALTLGVLVSASKPSTYRSTASFVVSLDLSEEGLDFGDRVYGLDSLNRRNTVATYSEILVSERIFDTALDVLDRSREREKYTVSAVVLPETSIIRVSVTGHSAKQATALLEEMSRQANVYIATIDDVYQMTSLDRATAPSNPISPNPRKDGVVAGVLGLLFGSIIAVARTPEILGESMEQRTMGRRRAPLVAPYEPLVSPLSRSVPNNAPQQNGAHVGSRGNAE